MRIHNRSLFLASISLITLSLPSFKAHAAMQGLDAAETGAALSVTRRAAVSADPASLQEQYDALKEFVDALRTTDPSIVERAVRHWKRPGMIKSFLPVQESVAGRLMDSCMRGQMSRATKAASQSPEVPPHDSLSEEKSGDLQALRKQRDALLADPTVLNFIKVTKENLGDLHHKGFSKPIADMNWEHQVTIQCTLSSLEAQHTSLGASIGKLAKAMTKDDETRSQTLIKRGSKTLAEFSAFLTGLNIPTGQLIESLDDLGNDITVEHRGYQLLDQWVSALEQAQKDIEDGSKEPAPNLQKQKIALETGYAMMTELVDNLRQRQQDIEEDYLALARDYRAILSVAGYKSLPCLEEAHGFCANFIQEMKDVNGVNL